MDKPPTGLKIERYCILANPNPGELAEQVNRAIASGWQPVGPVVVYPETSTDKQSLMQTIVKWPAAGAD